MLKMVDSAQEYKLRETKDYNFECFKSSWHFAFVANLRLVLNSSQIKMPTTTIEKANNLGRGQGCLCGENEIIVSIFWQWELIGKNTIGLIF